MNDSRPKEANGAEDIGTSTSTSKPPVDPRVVKIDEYGNPLDGTPLDESKKQIKTGGRTKRVADGSNSSQVIEGQRGA